LTEQREVVVLPIWARVQVPPLLKPPAPLLPKFTDPPGKLLVGVSVSLTVAVQLVGTFTGTVAGAQLTDVAVVRLVTATAKVPLLVAWMLSAEYVPVTVWVPVPIAVGV
jgi:hypothetical protein